MHSLGAFTSREPGLDRWLRERALPNEGRTSRTYVVCEAERVVGYYALVNGAVQRASAIARLRRNAPDPVPVMILARLAVDTGWEGRGIGKGLQRDAVRRTIFASETSGIAALLVHAISEQARSFYVAHGFLASDPDPLTLMLPLGEGTGISERPVRS